MLNFLLEFIMCDLYLSFRLLFLINNFGFELFLENCDDVVL